MKKTILILLCFVLIIVMISCNGNRPNATGAFTEETDEKNSDGTVNDEKESQSIQQPNVERSESDSLSLEKYIGMWYDDFIPPNDLKIISKGNGDIEGELGIYRLTTFYLIITEGNEGFSFVDKNDRISGKIDFIDNSILVTVEESNTEYIGSGATWQFTIKDVYD